MFSTSQRRPRNGLTLPLGRLAAFAVAVAVLIASPSARTLGQGTEPGGADNSVRTALNTLAADLVANGE
jgi:hypothetical protein